MTIQSAYHVTETPDADVMLAKAVLVREINRLLKVRGVKNQEEAASLLGMSRPDVSNMLRGKFRGFSIERITTALQTLDSTARMRVIIEHIEPDAETDLALA